MKSTMTWAALLANDRRIWRAEMYKALLAREQHIILAAEGKRAKRKASFKNPTQGTVCLPELQS